jgi:hypothetical protein
VNALLHRLDVLEKEAIESKERIEVFQSNKEILEADNERMSALCDNKDVSENLASFLIHEIIRSAEILHLLYTDYNKNITRRTTSPRKITKRIYGNDGQAED